MGGGGDTETERDRDRKKERQGDREDKKRGRATLDRTNSPLSAHSLRSCNRRGVPASGLPFLDTISKPMLKVAIPLALPEHGNSTLKTVKTRHHID